MSSLKVGVVGAGHLGKIHLRLIQQIENVDLFAVADPSPLAQQAVIKEHEVEVISDYKKLIGEIDAAIIATPTRFHFGIAKELIENGIHVLVEKPLTDSVADAKELVSIATKNGIVASVGHVERFNPAIRAAVKLVGQPRFVQAARMSGFTFRSTDIGVVHDLMIHDIDLVNSIFEGEIEKVNAVGIGVIGDQEDISQAMLQFDCGGVANLTATRCSFQNERSVQIFGTDGYACVDLAQSKVSFVKVPKWIQDKRYDLLSMDADQQAFIREQLFTKVLPKSEIDVPRSNAILEEQKDWIECISSGNQPQVSIEQGAEAVEIADQVLDAIANNEWNVPSVLPMFQEKRAVAAEGIESILSKEVA